VNRRALALPRSVVGLPRSAVGLPRGAVALLAVIGLMSAACDRPASAATDGASATELTVYAAASLHDVLDRAVAAYEATVPGTSVVVSTDASSTLASQIELGAPADVFLSADTRNPQRLVDGGLTDGPAVDVASSRLVVVVPLDDPGGIATPADLARPGVKIIAAGDQVPITTYANQVVDRLARQPGYPADFAEAYAANVVSKEDNVRSAVAKVELGEGDAAIVYATDAARSTEVASIPIPDAVNVTATYAGVVVRSSSAIDAGHAFLTWLAGPDGQALFADFCFLPPP
jgi:molybdate transport system substrate-binding protein